MGKGGRFGEGIKVWGREEGLGKGGRFGEGIKVWGREAGIKVWGRETGIKVWGREEGLGKGGRDTGSLWSGPCLAGTKAIRLLTLPNWSARNAS